MINAMDQFVYANAPHLQESKGKMSDLIDKETKEWAADLPIEYRYNIVMKLIKEREERLKKLSRPPQDLVNEISILKMIMDKFHPGGEIETE